MSITRLIIGNAISLLSSVFLCLSGIARSKKNIYLFQFLECIFIIFSQIVFWQLSGAISMVFSATRNILASKDKYNLPSMIIILIGIVTLGVMFNTGGAIGYIPIIATAFLTFFTYFADNTVTVRAVIIINLIFWIIYYFLIFDIACGIINAIALLLNICFITKDIKEAKSFKKNRSNTVNHH